ncbi:hypothetical protein [Yoonia sp.]|uniref:hypothetical protein n=1 Tax=Yoonia sp. TaxID=2212373 RepID=UPI0023B45A80
MDLDLIFVTGVALVAFAVPSGMSAYVDRRWPRQAIMMLVLAFVAIAYALQENPDTYSIATIDETVVDVLGRYFN